MDFLDTVLDVAYFRIMRQTVSRVVGILSLNRLVDNGAVNGKRDRNAFLFWRVYVDDVNEYSLFRFYDEFQHG